MARAPLQGSRQSVSSEARKAFAIEGLKEIQANLAKVVNAVSGREMKDVYYEGGKILRDQARRNAPYDPKRTEGVHLRDAIFVGRGDESKPNVLVGVRYGRRGAPHAHFVEYGSAHNRAQPYLRPALVQAGPKVATTIKNGLLAVIEKHTKR